ncbi:MAG TPA: PP2C family protein-serine/threonine phosphatase [Polyangia bacterium]|nr:PP2C family protein-serine/threonine phosphatase [Polyangia bacterium]
MKTLLEIDQPLHPALSAPTRTFAGGGAPATVVSLASKLRVAAKQSAQLSAVGDFFEVYQHVDGRVSIVVADVCGNGAVAAQIAAEIRPALHHALVRGESPGRVLEALNEGLLGVGVPERFVTAIALQVDPRLCTGRLACAGHLGPFVRRTDGFAEAPDATGVPLGLLRDETYGERPISLSPGDTLVLVTDGITDPLSTEDDPLGAGELTRRLEAFTSLGIDGACDAASLCHTLLDDSSPRRDDATVLVLQLPGRELIPAAA